jgi:hypothetical protein
VLAFALAMSAVDASARAAPPPPTAATSDEDALERARTLDGEGARAYAEGHFSDAARLFEEAYRLGGPAFELWNVARCQLKLDRAEDAERTLTRYLAITDLPKKDRAEAEAQLAELRARRSTLVLITTPSGAKVKIDGQPVDEATPTSTEVSAGPHQIELTRAGSPTVTRNIDARLGRAVIVDVNLLRDGAKAPPAPDPYAAPAARTVGGRLVLFAMFPRYGTAGGSAHVGGLLRGGAMFPVTPRFGMGFGLAGLLTRDVWSNADTTTPLAGGCGLSPDLSAMAASAFVEVTGALRITRALSFVPHVGLGVASLSSDRTGGDLFEPTCTPSYGLRPAVLAAPDLELAVGVARLVVSPVMLQVNPAFEGARGDATGAWLRVAMGLGFGVDL